MNEKVVVLLSGGLDSTTLLYTLLDDRYDCVALSIHYGQRHRKELEAANAIALRTRTPWVEVDLGPALAPVFATAQSSQVGAKVPVPEGHYAEETMKATIVPNRNMMLLAVAGAFAISQEAAAIAYAAHAGDHPIYPDCRPEFISSANTTLMLGAGISLIDPFQGMTKADIVNVGADLNVPFALTRSCYNSGELQCGKCSTCVERREAFAIAGVEDPTQYEDESEFWKSVV